LPSRTSSIAADRGDDRIWIYGLAGSFITIINKITSTIYGKKRRRRQSVSQPARSHLSERTTSSTMVAGTRYFAMTRDLFRLLKQFRGTRADEEITCKSNHGRQRSGRSDTRLSGTLRRVDTQTKPAPRT
jgi:hypothetical protein